MRLRIAVASVLMICDASAVVWLFQNSEDEAAITRFSYLDVRDAKRLGSPDETYVRLVPAETDSQVDYRDLGIEPLPGKSKTRDLGECCPESNDK